MSPCSFQELANYYYSSSDSSRPLFDASYQNSVSFLTCSGEEYSEHMRSDDVSETEPFHVPSSFFEESTWLSSSINQTLPRKRVSSLKDEKDTNVVETSCKQRRTSINQTPNIQAKNKNLGNRIVALHQLVSPFGKTDTGSVLLEAIEYIHFLHNQVNELVNSRQVAKGWRELDLKSRGLCLMPTGSAVMLARSHGDSMLI